MKIGWSSVHEDGNEHALTRAFFDALRPAIVMQGDRIELFVGGGGALVSVISNVLDEAIAYGFDRCIVSYRPTWVLAPASLHALLESEGVVRAAVAIRAGGIVTRAAVFSPKLAYIDPDFIIVNVARCRELGIPEQLASVSFASHFENAGGIHADLLAFLETIVPYGALHVYDDGSDLQDLYGDRRGFAASPYLFSRRLGFVSATPARDPRVHAVRAALLQQYDLVDVEPLRAYVAAHARSVRVIRDRDGFSFLAKPLLIRYTSGIVSSAKRVLRTVNYEIQKRYEDKA